MKRSVFLPLLLLGLLCLNLVFTSVEGACKITVKLKSNTKQKFRIQVFVPSVKQKSEKVLFIGPEEKKLQVGNIQEGTIHSISTLNDGGGHILFVGDDLYLAIIF